MHFHKWDKWQVIEKGDIYTFNKDNSQFKWITGTFFYQTRKCLKCGFTQLDRQEQSV